VKVRLRFAAVAALTAVTVACSLSGSATAGHSPLYVAPPKSSVQTSECANLNYCYGVRGPWVVVPANGEATFLLGCPERAATAGAFLLGGADSRASSSNIRVWYDGSLGAPLGHQTTLSSLSGLLFHATSTNGAQGTFQPVVGCISLKQASKRSTLSARQASAKPTHVQPTPFYRSANVILEPGWDRTISKSCLRHEQLVGSWSAVSYGTLNPPQLPSARAVTVATGSAGRTVVAHVRTSASVPYLIRIQVGAVCEP
jgi:hypothetical protein